MKRFIYFPDAAALAAAAAAHVCACAEAAIAEHGYFAWALSGGNTPVPSYRLLADAAWRQRIDWSRVHIFFADERFVAPDHADSNYRLAREHLLQAVAIPAANVHCPPLPTAQAAGLTPEQSATAYQQTLLDFFAPAPPRFDLITLGMGPDGHTASLFPGMDDLGDGLVAAVHHSPKPPPLRLTMTYALLNQAHNLLFIVSGQDKAELLAEIADESAPPRLPASKVTAVHGPVVWMVAGAANGA